MYWDRFDIALAYWVYATIHHTGQGSAEYALYSALDRIGFEPGLLFSESVFLSSEGVGGLENAFEIYRNLAEGRKIRDRRPEA